jgi:hypothetical protein
LAVESLSLAEFSMAGVQGVLDEADSQSQVRILEDESKRYKVSSVLFWDLSADLTCCCAAPTERGASAL